MEGPPSPRFASSAIAHYSPPPISSCAPRERRCELASRPVAELLLHGRPVPTVFDLLGRDENDMTFALAWGMAHSGGFLSDVMRAVAAKPIESADAVINLQRHHELGGFTDVEVTVPGVLHVIFEAKRGWNLPTDAQLRLYAKRLDESAATDRRLVVLTQWGAEEFVASRLGQWELGYARVTLGWERLVTLAQRHAKAGPHAERRLLRELATYFSSVADMRDIDSNQAYVVSLSRGTIGGWPMSLVAVVEDHRRYFFPVGRGGWPKIPPNYMGFRYDGRLQSIHHVDDYAIATEMSQHLPGVPATGWDPHYVLTLGPPIRPAAEVRNGPSIMRAMRTWIDIDLLLTSTTITEALKATRERRSDTAGG